MDSKFRALDSKFRVSDSKFRVLGLNQGRRIVRLYSMTVEHPHFHAEMKLYHHARMRGVEFEERAAKWLQEGARSEIIGEGVLLHFAHHKTPEP